METSRYSPSPVPLRAKTASANGRLHGGRQVYDDWAGFHRGAIGKAGHPEQAWMIES